MLQRVSEAAAIRQLGPARSEERQGAQPAGVDRRQQSLQDQELVRDTVLLHGELEVLQQLLPLRREAVRPRAAAAAAAAAPTAVGHQERAVAAHEPDIRQRAVSAASRRQGPAPRHAQLASDHLQIRAEQPQAQHDGVERPEESGAVQRGDRRMGHDDAVDLLSGRSFG